MSDSNLGEAIGKWGTIGFIAGGGLPYLIGGWISEYSLITAFGGAMLFGFIAMEGAKAHSEDQPTQKENPPKETPTIEEKVLVPQGESEIEDLGYLRKDFQYSVDGHQMNVIAAVDYKGIGPLGEKGKTTINIFYSIPSAGIGNGLNMNYETTQQAIAALKNINSEFIKLMLTKNVSADFGNQQ